MVVKAPQLEDDDQRMLDIQLVEVWSVVVVALLQGKPWGGQQGRVVSVLVALWRVDGSTAAKASGLRHSHPPSGYVDPAWMFWRPRCQRARARGKRR